MTVGFQSTRPIRGATAVLLYRITLSNSFQSTRPIRGATTGHLCNQRLRNNFNPRAPYGARPSAANWCNSGPHFNPRAPYGARPSMRAGDSGPGYFNPRAPYGARRTSLHHRSAVRAISIHAPHTGRDRYLGRYPADAQNFNPRAPYGARPQTGGICCFPARFQSTRPIRGATYIVNYIDLS